MILARCSPHENGVFTYIDLQAGVVQKSTYNREAMENLQRECSGYRWYFARRGTTDASKLSFEMRPGGSYARLRVPLLKGQSPNYNLSLTENFSVLKKAIEHYFQIWPVSNDGLGPLHGDFSVGNLILDGGEVYIIDWEHFREKAAPYGFDLANMLYESLYFSLKGRSSLNPVDRENFFKLKQMITEKCSGIGSFEVTLQSLQKFISEHAEVWGQVQGKLPVMMFSVEPV